MKQPRKLKKAIKKALIIYDVAALPIGLSMNEMYKIFKEHGIILYDSTGTKPEIANIVGKRVQVIENKPYKK